MRLLILIILLLNLLVEPPVRAGDGSQSIAGNEPSPGTNAKSTSPGAVSPPRQYRFKPLTVPPEPATSHDANKTIPMGPFRLGSSLEIASLKPIRLDVGYNRTISLPEALYDCQQNSLPIRITRESWNYQKITLIGNIFNALPTPSFGAAYGQTWSRILSSAKSNATVFQPTLFLPVFQGGAQVFTMWAQYYRDKGWHQSYNASVNDALLDVYQNYENLLLQYMLLQIRAKSLQVSQQQLELNNTLYTAGTGTQFAIMQSRTQLAADRQAMQQQQVDVRQAGLSLAYALNLPIAVNLVPEDESITEQSIFDEGIPVSTLTDVAVLHRPELRQYELFHLAAQRNIQVAAAALYPTAGLFGTSTYAGTKVVPIGANVANGTAGAGVFPGVFDTYQGGYTVNWNLPYMGLPTAFNIASARVLANQAQLQANQELLLVLEQVRGDYLTALSTRAQIDSAAYGGVSASEGLRLAQLRLRSGVGSNLELITAQRNYTEATTAQAQAIIASNVAQAQLLHDMGVITIDALTSGFKLTPDLLGTKNSKP
jgi:outer membrane protein TolC